MSKATTRQWIAFFYPTPCIDRADFEKTLRQIQSKPQIQWLRQPKAPNLKNYAK